MWWSLALLACNGGSDNPPAERPADTDADADADADSDVDADSDADSDTDTAPSPTFSDPVLWADVPLAQALDLGHTPALEPAHVEASGLVFTEVSTEAGLAASVSGGNSHGVGVGFFDVDGDGWADIVHANGIANAGSPVFDSELWLNQRDGTFVDASASSGFAPLLAGLDTYSVSAADVDGDGDIDVHITAHPSDRLLLNDGHGHFVDGTAAAGLGGPPSVPNPRGSSKIGAWGDVNRDGWPDLAVASSQFEDQPAHGYLMLNDGDATFTDATAAWGLQIAMSGNPCAVLWTDYDNDGDLDLAVWNDRGDPSSNRSLLRNDGNGFTDVTTEAYWTNPMGNPMGIDGADIDRDGFLDYYVGNIGGNALLVALGDGTFVDYAASAGVQGMFSWGLAFEDFDHDQWWDLFVATEDDRPYLSFQNLRTDPPSFDAAIWEHWPVYNGHNVAAGFADFDHDGDTDVVTAPTSGSRMSLMRNDTDKGTNHWLEVVIDEEPVTGARGGVGARVVLAFPDGSTVFRDITGGSSRASQNAHSARFGLGPWDGVATVAVLWPDGRSLAAVNVPGDQVLHLTP